VAIARALINEPSLLLADEPTGNLDSHTGDEIMGLLQAVHADGNTLVTVTHDAGIAGRAGRRLTIRDGRIEDDRATAS
jgi:putative ABC transport system ATP-binding protein